MQKCVITSQPPHKYITWTYVWCWISSKCSIRDLSDKVTHTFIIYNMRSLRTSSARWFRILSVFEGMNMDMGKLRIDPVGLSHIPLMSLTLVTPLDVSLFGLQEPCAGVGAPTWPHTISDLFQPMLKISMHIHSSNPLIYAFLVNHYWNATLNSYIYNHSFCIGNACVGQRWA